MLKSLRFGFGNLQISEAHDLNVDVLDTALAISRSRVLLLVVLSGVRRLDAPAVVARSRRSRRGAGGGRGDRSRGLRAGRRAGGRSRGRGSSAIPDLRAGEGEVLSTVVDAEVGVGVLVAVCGRELDHGAGSAVATVGHLDLNARDVVLRLVDVGPVDTDVLEADEVLARGGAGGDLGGKSVLAPGAPCILGEVSGAASTLLVDLEPVTGTVVGDDIVIGSTRHVGEAGTGVLHLCANAELDAQLLTGSDLQDLSLAGVGEGALVADTITLVEHGVVADVLGRVAGELDGVVGNRTGRGADVFVRTGGNTVDNGGVEEVVGRGHLGEGTEGDGVLHFENV